ncbi:MAG: hypothetical protein GQE15_30255 [Archangiaceae bacterium]|nr:hypothetical protein [Archangiaceae bacterium]
MNRTNRLVLVVLFTALATAFSACGGVDVSTADGGTTSSSLTSCVHKDTRCTQSCSTCH